MITIVRKEITAHLMSLQFCVLFLISLLLFTASGLISAHNFDEELTAYSKKVASVQAKPGTVSLSLYRRPSSLQFLAGGETKSLPYGYVLRPTGVLEPRTSDDSNKKMPEAPRIDWALIVKLVFSLYAILLGYDAISGEKEKGTLSLIFSNSMGRVRFLTAKYAAILMTLFVPFMAGGLVCLLIVGIKDQTVLLFPNIFRVLVMAFLSAVYISIFAMLSLWISASVKQSSVALFLLLACWILAVVIIPNSAGILSEHLVKVPSEYQVSQSIRMSVDMPYVNKLVKEVEKRDKGEIKTNEELQAALDPLFKEGYSQRCKMADDYLSKVRSQFGAVLDIARISPDGLFQLAAESLSKTGNAGDIQFQKEVQRYSRTYDGYVKEKVGKLVPWMGYHLSFGGNLIGGKFTLISPPLSPEYKGDMSDFPGFIEKGPTLLESLKSALFDLAGLLVWNIVLALLAFGAFLRADVR